MTLRLKRGDRLVVASHNAGKIEEIRALLAPYGVETTSAAELGFPVPEETEETFEGNALIKASASAEAASLPALADDSGIEIDALGGAPGVRTADWAETPDGRDFGLAMQKAHDAIAAVGASEPSPARFVCVLALVWPDGRRAHFRGVAEGAFVWPPRGANGHGYDPAFAPLGDERTFGEMDPVEKNARSHRADAFRQFRAAVLGDEL